MQNIVTLVTTPAKHKLDERLLNKVFIALEKKGALISNINWLAADEACDVFFDNVSVEKCLEILSEKLSEYEVDFICQTNSENRKKKMLISDMDSTIIQQECIDEIADKLNLKDKVAEITERAMNGELDFSESLRQRVGLLEGLDESELINVYENNIQTMPGAKELVATMRANGAFCILVSGGFTFFTNKIAKKLDFHEDRANILEIKNSVLTGKVIEPILDSNSKLETLREKSVQLNIQNDDILAVGDGANDLPMLTNAGMGFAYHAKESVKSQVSNKIDYTGLTTILYAQGYKKEEFKNEYAE